MNSDQSPHARPLPYATPSPRERLPFFTALGGCLSLWAWAVAAGALPAPLSDRSQFGILLPMSLAVAVTVAACVLERRHVVRRWHLALVVLVLLINAPFAFMLLVLLLVVMSGASL